jgi:hypothetical protein
MATPPTDHLPDSDDWYNDKAEAHAAEDSALWAFVQYVANNRHDTSVYDQADAFIEYVNDVEYREKGYLY